MKLLLLSILLVLVGCGGNGNGSLKLMVFGDSIAETKDPKSFTYFIAEELNITIFNNAAPGTTIEARNQYPAMTSLMFTSADIVIFNPGINDLYYHGLDTTYLKTYENKLREILIYVGRSGAHIFVGTTLRTIHPYLTDPNVAVYADIMRKVVSELRYSNIHLVDTNALFTPTVSNMKDEVHPNALGHQELTNIFMTEIRKVRGSK